MKHRGKRGPGYNMARTLAEVRERKIRKWAHFRKHSYPHIRLRGPSFFDQVLPAIKVS